MECIGLGFPPPPSSDLDLTPHNFDCLLATTTPRHTQKRTPPRKQDNKVWVRDKKERLIFPPLGLCEAIQQVYCKVLLPSAYLSVASNDNIFFISLPLGLSRKGRLKVLLESLVEGLTPQSLPLHFLTLAPTLSLTRNWTCSSVLSSMTPSLLTSPSSKASTTRRVTYSSSGFWTKKLRN